MKLFFIPFLFFIFLFRSAGAGIELQFSQDKIKQGSLQYAEVRISSDLQDKINLNELSGKTLDEILFIESVEINNEKKQAVVIFTKVPQKNSVDVKISNLNTTVSWSGVSIEPVEVPKGFLWGDFTFPEPLNLFKLISASVVVLLALFFGTKIFKKFKVKKLQKLRRRHLMEKLISGHTYEDVVSIWKDKQNFISEFPKVAEEFKSLEKVLFKYQFKPSQTISDKDEVMKAYHHFVESLRGGQHGI